jgi:hypothetical protein
MFWNDFGYQFLSLTHPLNVKRHTLIFTFTYTSFLVEDSLHCIPQIAENTCQSSQLEHVVQSVQQWWMVKIDQRISMNEIVPSRKVLGPSFLLMN